MTAAARLSPKFKVSIPKAVRERLAWNPRQKIAFIARADGVLMTAIPEREDPAGIAQGANSRRLSESKRSLLMRVVDTSDWINWMLCSPLGRIIEAELPSNDAWIVQTELRRAA